jgi:inorganic pyrophosphatase
LFESFVGSIIAAMALANGDLALVMCPFWVAGAGVVASILGYFAVRTKDDANQKQLLFALHKGTIVAAIFTLIFSAVIVYFLFVGRESEGWRVFGCIVVGQVDGIVIGQITEYFTSYHYYPTRSIADAGVTGPATVIIQGLGVSMISCVFPVLVTVATILICDALANEYGIAMAAVGMLATLGLNVASDTYGAISDNAGGIAEMAHLDERVREVTDNLDALGNTTAATGKGFAMGSAVLTALSLLAAFKEKSKIEVVDIGDPIVLSGALIGAMLPFLFSALTMLSVQRAAHEIIIEVRRQFDTIPGLRDGDAEPDSDRCIAISTQSAIHEMILPGLYAILTPMAVGLLVGPRCLTGMLGGAISSGMCLAIMMANAGGAWDNSKKYVEIEGAHGGKHTPVHVACVVGDIVGDPFKDTSGPSLNILIKLMSIISLTMAPMIAGNGDWPADWWKGLFPIAVMVLGTYVVYRCFWKHAESVMPVNLSSKDVEAVEREVEKHPIM